MYFTLSSTLFFSALLAKVKAYQACDYYLRYRVCTDTTYRRTCCGSTLDNTFVTCIYDPVYDSFTYSGPFNCGPDEDCIGYDCVPARRKKVLFIRGNPNCLMSQRKACSDDQNKDCSTSELGKISCCDGGGNNSDSDYVECMWSDTLKSSFYVWKTCPGGLCSLGSLSKRDGDTCSAG